MAGSLGRGCYEQRERERRQRRSGEQLLEGVTGGVVIGRARDTQGIL